MLVQPCPEHSPGAHPASALGTRSCGRAFRYGRACPCLLVLGVCTEQHRFGRYGESGQDCAARAPASWQHGESSVQTGTEQSLRICIPLNLGHRVVLTLWAVTAWDKGTVPSIVLEAGESSPPLPRVGARWEGRSASQSSVPLAINSWWFLLLRSEGDVSWGILHA